MCARVCVSLCMCDYVNVLSGGGSNACANTNTSESTTTQAYRWSSYILRALGLAEPVTHRKDRIANAGLHDDVQLGGNDATEHLHARIHIHVIKRGNFIWAASVQLW